MLWPTGSFSWEQQHTTLLLPAIPPQISINGNVFALQIKGHGSLMSTCVFLLFVGLASYTMLCPLKPPLLDAGLHIYARKHSTNSALGKQKP